MAAEGDARMVVERSNPIMNHRFSTLRFMRTVRQLNPIQRGFITSRNMGYLLKMPKHLMVPSSLLHWLVYYTVPRSGGKFKKKNKIMWFTKNIADKVFGFETDSFRYPLGSNDPAVVSEVEAIRLQYVKGKDVPIHHLEGILLGTNDEVKFLRSFIWYFLSTVLCPSTKNICNPKYLYGLIDRHMPDIQYWDYVTLCIENLFEEIDEWKVRSICADGGYNTSGWIGGCVPLLAVGYMDFIDFSGNDGGIDYGIPRMQHIRNKDFVFLENADRNRQSRRQYGILPFRTFSLTSYGDPNNVDGDPPFGIPPEYYAPYAIESYYPLRYPPAVPYDDSEPYSTEEDSDDEPDDNENVLDEDAAFNEDPRNNEEIAPNEDGVVRDNDVEIQDVIEEEIKDIWDEESEIQERFIQMVAASEDDEPEFGDIGMHRNNIELPLAFEGPAVVGDAANIDNDVLEEEIKDFWDEESEIQERFIQMVAASEDDEPEFGEHDGGDGGLPFNDNEDANSDFDIGMHCNDIEPPLATEGPAVGGDAANIDNDVILSGPKYFPDSSPQLSSGGRPSLHEGNTSDSVDAHISNSIHLEAQSTYSLLQLLLIFLVRWTQFNALNHVNS